MNFVKFLMGRLATFLMVIFIGITTVFIIPRLMPSDPVEAMIGQMMSSSGSMDPAAVESIRNSLNAAYGLDGTLWEQYTGFLQRVLITHDFGPSLMSYPTPVIDIIMRAIPWTFGLLTISTLIAWFIGNGIGLLAGTKPNKWYSKALEGMAMLFYPIPYYVFALALIMVFCFMWPIFPLSFTIVGSPATWVFWKNALFNSLLPATSIILTGIGWWVISMKTISSDVSQEDYVSFAKLKGLPENKVMKSYVLRNSMLPQVTMLALQMGTVFNGSLITEILFNYPGLGSLMYRAILQADYNLIMGTISISIVAVAVMTLIVDLIYPLIDPRIRYK